MVFRTIPTLRERVAMLLALCVALAVAPIATAAPTPFPILDKSGTSGYISGYPDGTFRAEMDITRYEAAALFYAIVIDAGKEAYQAYAGEFSDAATGQWYSEAVGYLSAAGVLSGYEDGTYGGENPITRAEFVAIASKISAFEITEPMLSHAVPFIDVPKDHWAYDYIDFAYTNMWVFGYPDWSFRPDALITRAEAVVIVNKMLGIMPEIIGGDPPFTDLAGVEWHYYEILAAAKKA